MKPIRVGLLAFFGFAATSLATPLYYWNFNSGSHPLEANIGNASASVVYFEVGAGFVYLAAGTDVNALTPGADPNYSLGAISSAHLYQLEHVTFQNLDFRNQSNIQISFAARTYEFLSISESLTLSYQIGSGGWTSIALDTPSVHWSIYRIHLGEAVAGQNHVNIRLTFLDGPGLFDFHEIDNVQIIPEPSAAGLLLAGLALMGVLRSRARSFRTLSRFAA